MRVCAHSPLPLINSCDENIWSPSVNWQWVEAEKRESEVEGQFWLYNEFKANLGYMRPWLKSHHLPQKKKKEKATEISQLLWVYNILLFTIVTNCKVDMLS